MIWPRIHRSFSEIDPEVRLILSTHMAGKPLAREAHIQYVSKAKTDHIFDVIEVFEVSQLGSRSSTFKHV